MTIKFNGLEYQESITLKDLCKQLNKADGFKTSIKNFKVVEDKKEQTAQELIDEVILNDPSCPSYWRATKPMKERRYYNYAHLKRNKGKIHKFRSEMGKGVHEIIGLAIANGLSFV